MATIPFPTSPADRFAGIIEAFRRVVAAEAAKNRLLESVLVLIWSRLGRIAQTVARLAARIPPDAPSRPHVSRPRAAAKHATPLLGRAARRKTAQHLPRRAGWVMRFIPASVFPARSQLQAFFADEAVQRLIAASPGIRRELRPLCRMLGLDLPPLPAPLPDRAPPTQPLPRSAMENGPAPPRSNEAERRREENPLRCAGPPAPETG